MVPDYIEKEIGIDKMHELMCFLVHPQACLVGKDEDEYGEGKVDVKETVAKIFSDEETEDPEEQVRVPGVFMVFRPEQVEYVTDATELEDESKTKKIESMKERGIKIIEFPKNYWDKEEEASEEEA
jgi:hypothetical protein